MRIAMIGTRKFGEQPAAFTEDYIQATHLVGQMHDVCVTGAAKGSDQVAARESYLYGAELVLVLPWLGYERAWYEEFIRSIALDRLRSIVLDRPITTMIYRSQRHHDWTESVNKWHPAPSKLTPASFALHARNYGIVFGADAVCALPGATLGGTGQGMRIAQGLGIPLFDFSRIDALTKFEAWRAGAYEDSLAAC